MSIFNRQSTIDSNSPKVKRHRPSISTVFSRWWIGIDRWYRPWSIDRVDKSVDRCRYWDRCWDRCSPNMGQLLLGGCVSGTISYHLWDHRSMILFSDFSEKRGRPIFCWYESTSTVDFDRFFFWNRRSLRYQPWFHLGKSGSTVDIDRILK